VAVLAKFFANFTGQFVKYIDPMAMQKIKKIAVFTSGGDAPGMNACIRAVVRAGHFYKLEVAGIVKGYSGMISGDFREMGSNSVSNIIHRGGTILKTARCSEFMTIEGRQKAFDQLKKNNVDAVVAIGGDGTFRGANEFSETYDIPFIGIPGTIDNDLFGTDFTIGYDTAINTVVQAVDKIRDTAESHDRLFFIEVMGRDAGFIALRSGIGVGAEAILIPETRTHIDQLISLLEKGWKRKKTSSIVIVAEGDDAGGAFAIAEKVKEKFTQYDTRVTVLGHIQRGGSPSCMDRLLAGKLGVGAVEGLLQGKKNVMVGQIHKDIVYTPFDQSIKHVTEVNKEFLRIAEILSS
jgi:6-phosphofructokinase 1